jgi:NAD(P)H-dependent FMN reductase
MWQVIKFLTTYNLLLLLLRSNAMEKIVIISSSVRRGRKSHRVALWFKRYLVENGHPDAEIADLLEYNFPLFDERLSFQEKPSEAMLDFAGKIRNADGVIIVTPEYNGGFPGSLKNVIDLLGEEWNRKTVAIATVSEGSFGGSRVIIPLQFTLWKMGALTVPSVFQVPKVDEAFDENGNPTDKAAIEKRTAKFVQELLWSIEARKRMDC